MTNESEDEASREASLLRAYMDLTGCSEAVARNTVMYACYLESEKRDVERQDEQLRRLEHVNQSVAAG